MSIVKQATPQHAATLLEQGAALLVDVREVAEHAKERIEGAVHIPLSAFDPRVLPNDKPLVIHCLGGMRAQQAAEHLVSMGFGDVHNLVGGLMGWKKAGFATVA